MSKFADYELVNLNDSGIKAVAGIKVSEWLHSGRYLLIGSCSLTVCSTYVFKLSLN